MRTVNQKLRKAIEDEGRLTRIEGDLVAALDHAAQPSASPPRSACSGSHGTAMARSRSPAEAGRRTARSRRATGASRRRSVAIRPASSTTTTASGRATRTPRSSRAQARSGSRLPIAPPATGSPARRPTLSCASGRPASTSAPILRTCASSMADDAAVTRRAPRDAAPGVEVDRQQLNPAGITGSEAVRPAHAYNSVHGTQTHGQHGHRRRGPRRRRSSSSASSASSSKGTAMVEGEWAGTRHRTRRPAGRDRDDAHAGRPQPAGALALSRAGGRRRPPDRAGERPRLPARDVRGRRPR